VLKSLQKADEAELQALFEDDRITDEIYREKLNAVLGISQEESPDAEQELGNEARSVLGIWERMDEGRIHSVAEGLEEAERAAEGEPAGDGGA
jgi:hypothetical protein